MLFSHQVTSDPVTPQPEAHQAPLSKGTVQARILEWVVVPSSRGSSRPRDGTRVCCVAGGLFATEPPGKPEGRGATGWRCASVLPLAVAARGSVEDGGWAGLRGEGLCEAARNRV